MKRARDTKPGFHPEYEFTVRVTFVMYDDANALDHQSVFELVCDIPNALSDSLSDVLEHESCAVTSEVKKVVVEVGQPKQRKDYLWT